MLTYAPPARGEGSTAGTLFAVLGLSFIALLYFMTFEKAALKGRSLLLAFLVLSLLALL